MTRLRSLLTRASFGGASPQRSPSTGANFGEGSPRRWPVILLSLVFLALHLPYLPASLEDLDSINFALGLRQFDVAHHQPHPPGYPVFMLTAKAVHAVVPSEAAALGLVSVAGGALGVLAAAALFRRIDCGAAPANWSLAAVVVTMTTPLYWFTAVRPLSDSMGLAAAIGVQALTLAASSARGLAVAGLCAGLAAGLRSQVVWLTMPLLIVKGLGAKPLAPSPKSLVPALAAFVIGLAIWFVPLVIISGGPAAYWHALFDQGAEDLGNIQMLWTRHGLRDVLGALYYAFVAPWAVWPIAAVVLVSAAVGILRLAVRERQTLIVLAVAFVPYLVFDLLFQETFTGRYALPLVVPIAYLAVSGLRALPWDTGLAIAVALSMFCAHVGGTSIAAYSRAPAPAFRLLDAMTSAFGDGVAPVLAMDRRESLDLRRPMKWRGEAMPAAAQTLPAPPQHEWLEAVKYWNGGGSAPVWFVVDPLRTSIDLVQHGDPVRFRWPLAYPVLLSGARPNEMDWYRVATPEWYVGEGWALTPEAAGVAEADRRDPSHGSITGWVHGSATSGGTLMIGGRSFDPTLRPRLTVTLSGRPFIDDTLMPGTFLKFVSLPLAQRDARAPAYDALTVTTTAGARTAVEQFDASATRPILGFGEGWQEQEFNPRTGVRWRWLSERGELRVQLPLKLLPPDGREFPPATLHLEGESPLTYFARGSTLTIHVGPRVVLTRVLNADFSIDLPVHASLDSAPIVLETDQVFSPADSRWRKSADRRHLGLRIFKAEIRITGAPAS